MWYLVQVSLQVAHLPDVLLFQVLARLLDVWQHFWGHPLHHQAVRGTLRACCSMQDSIAALILVIQSLLLAPEASSRADAKGCCKKAM